MDNIQILKLEDSPFSLREVYAFIKEVYSDRKNQGIDFWLSKCSFEEYMAKVEKDKKVIFVAFDFVTKELLGTASLTIRQDKKGRKYGGMTNCAVKRNCQNCNIGTMLVNERMNMALKENCQYLQSTTAINATSSVKWHLKNGYYKYGFGSGSESSYYSYKFRMPLTNHNKVCYRIACQTAYAFSYVKTKCIIKKDGGLTWLGRIGKKMI